MSLTILSQWFLPLRFLSITVGGYLSLCFLSQSAERHGDTASHEMLYGARSLTMAGRQSGEALLLGRRGAKALHMPLLLLREHVRLFANTLASKVGPAPNCSLTSVLAYASSGPRHVSRDHFSHFYCQLCGRHYLSLHNIRARRVGQTRSTPVPLFHHDARDPHIVVFDGQTKQRCYSHNTGLALLCFVTLPVNHSIPPVWASTEELSRPAIFQTDYISMYKGRSRGSEVACRSAKDA